MPVEDVHVVHGQEIEELLDKRDGEEMPRTVEVHASPTEPRSVGDGGRCQGPGVRRQTLA